MKYFVDTSFWCALYDLGDINHESAEKIWTILSEAPVKLITSDYIFDETVTVVSSRISHQAGVKLGKTLLESKVVTIVRVNQEYFNSGWTLLQSHSDKKYSFTDCTSFAIMQNFELDNALAYDHHFAQMGFAVNQL